MPSNLEGVFALASGVGGFLLVQFGNLIPSRRDFQKDISLKIESCLEGIASRHCFLIKECLESSQSPGLEGFDNLLRGDGRTGRDHFAEHAKGLVSAFQAHKKLLAWRRWFAVSHSALFCALVLLVVAGVASLVVASDFTLLSWVIFCLFILELVALGVVYFASSQVELLE